MSLCVKYERDALREDVKRLQKENAELRDCLKEAVHEYMSDHCRRGCPWWDATDYNPKYHKCRRPLDMQCFAKKWSDVLEGVNHAND